MRTPPPQSVLRRLLPCTRLFSLSPDLTSLTQHMHLMPLSIPSHSHRGVEAGAIGARAACRRGGGSVAGAVVTRQTFSFTLAWRGESSESRRRTAPMVVASLAPTSFLRTCRVPGVRSSASKRNVAWLSLHRSTSRRAVGVCGTPRSTFSTLSALFCVARW